MAYPDILQERKQQLGNSTYCNLWHNVVHSIADNSSVVSFSLLPPQKKKMEAYVITMLSVRVSLTNNF
jgi:hypothetical protein